MNADFWIVAWTVSVAVTAAILFVACLVLKLNELGISPLRGILALARRPWFERFLVLFLVGGLVQYAATKGDGGGSRGNGASRQGGCEVECAPAVETARVASAPSGTEVTNLCFTAISVRTNGVVLDLAWPTNMFERGALLDFFAKESLGDEWRWMCASQSVPGATNLSLFVDASDDQTLARPGALFFKAQERASCASTMADSDGDGLPDVYELHNGTNPYLPDSAGAPKLTVGTAADYSTLEAALAASTNYSIIEMSAQDHISAETIVMPSHPVMVTGPADGYAILRSSASVAAIALDGGQNEETLFRNLYVVLAAKEGFQAAFWVGGSLPWTGEGASSTFENVRVRALYPDVLHYGWHYYRDDGGCSRISNCVMNAAGSDSAVGIYAYDGPAVDVSACSFVNFPSNADGCAIWLKRGSSIVEELPVAQTNLSWAGCRLDAHYGEHADADGDGLPDGDEVLVYDTDPWLADSDGDGLPDADEIASGTDPRDVRSFFHRITVGVAASDSLTHVTNFVAWGFSGEDWETNGLQSCGIGPSTNVLDVLSFDAPLYVKTFRDLNGNGRYDVESDILLCRRIDPGLPLQTFDFAFGDIDGDGILDHLEKRHGTDPFDPRNYCFNASLVEKDVFCTTNFLTAEIRLGDAAIVGPLVLTNRTWEIDLGHLVSTNAEPLIARFWDDANSNGLRDEGECCVSQALVVAGHENCFTNTLARGEFDGDDDGMLDSWELLHADAGLSPTNAADAFLDPDCDGLINLHECWADCDPLVPDGSNTVLSVCARSIDERIQGKDSCISKDKFVNYLANAPSGRFVANTNCWAYGIDTTCASANNSIWGNYRAGTAISFRHVALAEHYTIPIGQSFVFVASDGVVYTRRTIDGMRVLDTDIYIMLLDNPLPAAIKPAWMLPSDYMAYIRTGKGLPVLMFDFDEHAIVNELDDLPTARGSVNGFRPIDPLRQTYFEGVESGDSGNPKFLVVGDEAILVSTLTTYGRNNSGVGPAYPSYTADIQNVMDELSDRNGKPRETLRYFDFSSYQALREN